MTADRRTVCPAPPLCGELRVPGDKSISHRAAMLGALAAGDSEVEGFLESEDCLHTLRAMRSLGAAVSREGGVLRIGGTCGALHAPDGPLDLGNSGTGLRLLAGLLAGQPFESQLTGDASLRSRPMARIKTPLELMGARVTLHGPGGCAPMELHGGGLRAVEYALPVASAQVKSCVLLAGLFARGRTTVIEPSPTRDHTERLLRAMGGDVTVDGPRIHVTGTGAAPRLSAGRWRVPGDFSSAAFWLTAAAGRPGAQVRVEGVGLNPRRTAFLDVLRRMGADVRVEPCADASWEPVGTVHVRGARLRATAVGGDEIPNLIDELPLVAAAGAFADGVTEIRDAAELRVKESDRIAATGEMLTALGVTVRERPDGMLIEGDAGVAGGAPVETRGDHRIAMAAAVLALGARRAVRIDGVDCIATSYPGFWDDLAALTGGVHGGTGPCTQ